MSEISMAERRRQAPGHYYIRADNARYSSRVLSSLYPSSATTFARDVDFRGDPATALAAAARREMSLAIELIVKAVIAQRLENREHLAASSVPMTHNVPVLWRQARLPELEEADQRRLHAFGVIMTWAGRYAAPTPGGENKPELSYPLEPTQKLGRRQLFRNVIISWDDFERIYQVAQAVYGQLQPDI
ncbi:hypothetical protein [Ancylobacter radicis]|uniref:hypothetical protein n=1 Tax=Ancylobacter radicis TaxID=2836179 RepID=UPI0020230B0D|nr:hypothetical protein [Ancylobacter radicis]